MALLVFEGPCRGFNLVVPLAFQLSRNKRKGKFLFDLCRELDTSYSGARLLYAFMLAQQILQVRT